MGKLLYIGNDIENITCGADAVNKRNLKFIRDIFSNDEIIIQELSKITFIDKFLGYAGGLNRKIETDILRKLDKFDIEFVFISHSLLGRVAKKIKKKYKDVVIITFYHNIEVSYAKAFLKEVGFRGLPFYFISLLNEKIASEFSDRSIVLNKRDKDLLKSVYNREATGIIPISYGDEFDRERMNIFSSKNEMKIKLLFVGVSFFANTSGIMWFINNVLPSLDVELSIVGKGMDVFFSDLYNEKVKVYGYVDNLSNFYYDAHLVIAPIFTGAGMKTKVAEAMMYGKTVIGTKEAFEGYDLIPKAHYLFKDSDECISIINSFVDRQLEIDKFNSVARRGFLEFYSNNAVLKNMRQIF